MADTMGDIITIHNFHEKLPTIEPGDGNAHYLYALVDMGSNGIRFSISDLSPPHSRLLKCIHRERAAISLYDALHESGPDSKPFYFSDSTITRVAHTLSRFKSTCDAYSIPPANIAVFATEAMRTAKNRDAMLQAIYAHSGLKVDILAPEMESMFGALGARSGFDHVEGLFMDLGGGSVQMTYMDSQSEGYELTAATTARSLPFGAAKLSAQLSNEISAKTATAELSKSMKATFEMMRTKFPQLQLLGKERKEGITIYFCGGGFRGYGSMLMHDDPIQPYPIPEIGGYVVPGERFVEFEKLLEVNREHEGKIFGMSKRRREQFPAIVTVVSAVIEAVGRKAIKEVVFCAGGDREGVLFSKLPKEVRLENPLLQLPSPDPVVTREDSVKNTSIKRIASLLLSVLPLSDPALCGIPPTIAPYLAANIWTRMGSPDSANSSNALHDPISGSLAGLPGLTHRLRAIIALILCARWGMDLAPADRVVLKNIREVIGSESAFWCEFLGTVMMVLAEVNPAFPIEAEERLWRLRIDTSMDEHAGKKGRQTRINVNISFAQPKLSWEDAELSDLAGMLQKVGKGLDLGWKVKVEHPPA
ncbi:putative retrograde regulation protein 2 [Xylogone sp. PMI_703]|nr:putative retrograde regulation protein 2 [Xylogone sp. PMI_703]